MQVEKEERKKSQRGEISRRKQVGDEGSREDRQLQAPKEILTCSNILLGRMRKRGSGRREEGADAIEKEWVRLYCYCGPGKRKGVHERNSGREYVDSRSSS